MKQLKIVLNRIYEKNKISTDITKSEPKVLLNLCTKIVHFTFDGNIYVQNDSVAMGSPLGPVLPNILGAINNANSNGQDEVLDKVC